MDLKVAAVGRLKAGPERELCDRYIERTNAMARSLGFRGPAVTEIVEDKSSKAPVRRQRESAALIANLPDNGLLVALDETGTQITSRQFAELLARARDEGAPALAFAIGGPDGHDRALADRAWRTIALGKATWPHMLARILLAEQLYRAMTILAGHPYHRD